jgi:transposase
MTALGPQLRVSCLFSPVRGPWLASGALQTMPPWSPVPPKSQARPPKTASVSSLDPSSVAGSEVMLNKLKRHQIQVLRRAGHTLDEVAKLAGVSQKSVQRVSAEVPIATLEEPHHRIGRPSKAEPFRQLVVREIAKQPDVLSVELLRRARLEQYSGGKSALYELIREIRPHKPRQIVRFEGLPGEFTQHDFGHVDVRFIDGTHLRVHFFGSRLKYSRWVEVSLVPNERAETLVRTMVDHFTRIGGIPLLAVFDRPKTIAKKWGKDGQVTEWNPTFAGVALDLGLGVELCWPYSPEQKGSVENLVKWVKGSFFKQRRFLDWADLERQLSEWLHEVNTLRPSRATNVIPAQRLLEEKPRLRPLKVSSEELALRIPVVVGPTAMVIHDGHLYSMDPESIGIPGTLYLYKERVRIVAGRYRAEHPRQFEPSGRSILPEHRAAHVAAVSGKRAQRYQKREQLLALGPIALEYLTELTHRRPKVWIRDVDRLHELLLTHGEGPVRTAMERGVAEHLYGAEYVAHFLLPQMPLFEKGAP